MVEEMRLNLACGLRREDGYKGIDIIPGDAVDIVMDLESFPWDIKSESVEDMLCYHYIEHTKDLIKFMNECHRILKPGGVLRIIAPYYSSIRAWQDPTHTRSISEYTFLYFNENWRKQNMLDHYPTDTDFDFVYGYNFAQDWQNRSEEARAFALKHYINVAEDIHVTLTKKVKEEKK